ncbi:hypothetical protein Fot_35168 [Forsythia ovata]|uniref:Uncharacterized protein n=1 Tax=Forsythia ovata TaxID=205694 RepID=A0ABD1SKR4_9LAMI
MVIIRTVDFSKKVNSKDSNCKSKKRKRSGDKENPKSMKWKNVRGHQFCIYQMINGHAVFTQHVAITGATQVATNADNRANATRETMDFTFFLNSVIEFAKHGAGTHTGSLSLHVDINRPKIEHVENDKLDTRYIRNALIIMATTADFELYSQFLSTQNICRNMGFLGRSHNYGWFRVVETLKRRFLM